MSEEQNESLMKARLEIKLNVLRHRFHARWGGPIQPIQIQTCKAPSA